MRAKVAEREEARRLRAEGMSVKRIAAQVGVSVSSVSVWVRDLDVPRAAAPKRRRKLGRSRGPEVVEGPGRVCSRCHRELTLASFNRLGDGYQYYCRECFRTYFRDRGELHYRQVRDAKAARVAVAVTFVGGLLHRSSCKDCGEDNAAVLEFDHVGEKFDNVARMVWDGASVGRLRDEIDRCEIVCVCCHRRRTARRANWPRLTAVAPPHWSVTRRRNFEHVMSVLTFSGCEDCGERDPVVPDFDHVGEKTRTISELVRREVSLKHLKIEIAQCEVRCANCHRLVTRARRGSTWRDPSDWIGAGELG